MSATAKRFRVPTLRPDEIPTEKAIKARVKKWLRYSVDKADATVGSGKTEVARKMGMSVGHITNVYNSEERGPGIRFMVCMYYGLELTMHEMVHEDPPTITREAVVTETPSRPRVGRAKRRALVARK